jgi:chemotaxis protein MotB
MRLPMSETAWPKKSRRKSRLRLSGAQSTSIALGVMRAAQRGKPRPFMIDGCRANRKSCYDDGTIMKSVRDGEIPEYSLRPKTRTSAAPWLLFLIALAVAAGAGWLALDQHDKAVAVETKLLTASNGASTAETKQKELQQKLDAAEAERTQLAAARDELSKNVASKDEELAKLKGTYDQLQDKLKGELKSGDVSLSQDGGKLRVGLVDKVLFNSGEAQISKRGDNVLARVGSILANIPDKQIQVSGHTDVWPIGEKRSKEFPTNWELSTARATNVVRFLQEKAGVPGDRLVASGFGEYHPVASNKSSVGRAKNRRIEILLTPSLELKRVAKSTLKAEAKPPVEAKAVKRPK